MVLIFIQELSGDEELQKEFQSLIIEGNMHFSLDEELR
jgi:hypothetical protein